MSRRGERVPAFSPVSTPYLTIYNVPFERAR